MRKLSTLLITLMVVALSGCQLAGDIFKTGFALGIIIVLVVVFLIVWVISAVKGKE